MVIKTYTVNVSHYFEYDSFNSDREVLQIIEFRISDMVPDHNSLIEKWKNHVINNRRKYPKFIRAVMVLIFFGIVLL